jgi:hypothetical protein
MPIFFTQVLREAGFPPVDVRLLRHKDRRAAKGRTPYELWRDNRPQFELYQATQKVENRHRLKSEFWASFVGTPADETMFVGVWRVRARRLLEKDLPKPHMEGVDIAISSTQGFQAEGLWDDINGRVQLRLKHDDLLGFIFWQLAHAVFERRRFNQCVVCGKYSLLATGFSRKDRTTCSGYCRVRLYRLRTKSRELHALGWSPRRIAKEIGLDVSKVDKWLLQRKA